MQLLKDFSAAPGRDLSGDINRHMQAWRDAHPGQEINVERFYTYDRIVSTDPKIKAETWAMVVFQTQAL